MDKKKFIPPELEITWFETEDIITTSDEEDNPPKGNEIHDDL